MESAMNFENTVLVVTGAARGIGAATAVAFVEAGAQYGCCVPRTPATLTAPTCKLTAV
jgi:NAD(P)-dependent dehydrogenase (short-subunit alcohol dehydrogenase family)